MTIKTSMLLKVFRRCPNLKEFHFVDNGLEFDSPLDNKVRLKLKLLKVTNESRIYDLLHNSSVKLLSLSITRETTCNQSLKVYLRIKNIKNFEKES